MTKQAGLPDGQPPSGGLPLPPWLRYSAQVIFDTALNLLYPPQCISCARHVGSLYCERCQTQLETPQPIRDGDGLIVERRATAYFDGPIRQAIHALKYEGKFSFAEVLGRRLAATLAQSAWQPTVLTVCPLHPVRLRERGYNQSDLLARPLAHLSNVPYRPRALQRTRDTRHQVGLNAAERQTNVAGAFSADPNLVRGQVVLVIDDVFTTGATLRECAQALLQAEASAVYALTVAASAPHHPLS